MGILKWDLEKPPNKKKKKWKVCTHDSKNTHESMDE